MGVELEDGYLGTTPVAAFAANGFGLHNTSGTSGSGAPTGTTAYPAASPRSDPRGPEAGEARVIRGGSYLCHDSYCNRYRVGAHSSTPPTAPVANLGFRCARGAT